MASVKRFEDLDIWITARTLCKLIYLFTKKEAFARDFKFVNQINSAGGSMMDNVAEGFGRASRNEFVQFLSIAKGSACEVQSQLHRALDRQYISTEEFNESYQMADKFCAGTNSLITYLNKSSFKGEKYMNRVQPLNS